MDNSHRTRREKQETHDYHRQIDELDRFEFGPAKHHLYFLDLHENLICWT